MTKAELYRRQGEQAARTIAAWPRWMRANIVTSSEEYWDEVMSEVRSA
jgi:hypothetical protein